MQKTIFLPRQICTFHPLEHLDFGRSSNTHKRTLRKSKKKRRTKIEETKKKLEKILSKNNLMQ